jgi:hypothetical protein
VWQILAKEAAEEQDPKKATIPLRVSFIQSVSE